MAQITTEIIALFALLIANGMFAMAEMAIVSVRKARLQQRASQGDKRALAALNLAHVPGPFLSTVQIGITLIGILAGAFGGATIAARLTPLLSSVPFIGPYSATIAFGLVVVFITYLSLVIGELMPKRLALHSPESIAVRVAAPMGTLLKLAAPLVKLLDSSTTVLLRLLGLREAPEPPVTEEEIKVLMEQGLQAGIFVEEEREMIERVFQLGDCRVKEIMVPRTQIVWLDLADAPEDIRATVIDSPHSCFPVVQGSPDNVVGLVHIKQLFAQDFAHHPVGLQAVLQPPLYIPETMSAFTVLELFKQSRVHFALVVNEYGGIEGLVTVNDILEAIVGELPAPGARTEPPVKRREDGSYLLDGTLSIPEFKKLFALQQLPGEGEDQYHTIGGFIMRYLGRIPSVTDQFKWHGLKFEVLDMDRNRVDKVLVTPMQADQRA